MLLTDDLKSQIGFVVLNCGQSDQVYNDVVSKIENSSKEKFDCYLLALEKYDTTRKAVNIEHNTKIEALYETFYALMDIS